MDRKCKRCGVGLLQSRDPADPSGEDDGLCWQCRSIRVEEQVEELLRAESGHCVGCGTELLSHIDADPNGLMNCMCARCRAEEAHDFDAEPGVSFDRSGAQITSPSLDLIAVAEAAAEWIDENREHEDTGEGQQAAAIYYALLEAIRAAKQQAVLGVQEELSALRG